MCKYYNYQLYDISEHFAIGPPCHRLWLAPSDFISRMAVFALVIHSKFILICSPAQLACFKLRSPYVERSIFRVSQSVRNSSPEKPTSLHSSIAVGVSNYRVQDGHVCSNWYQHYPVYLCIHARNYFLRSILDLQSTLLWCYILANSHFCNPRLLFYMFQHFNTLRITVANPHV